MTIPTAKKFSYQKKPPTKLETLTYKAFKNDSNSDDISALCEYLNSDDILDELLALPPERQRERLHKNLAQLAWFIGCMVTPRRPANRPLKSLATKTFAKQCAAYLVRIARDAWRSQHNYKKLPPQKKLDQADNPNAPPLSEWVQCAIKIVEREFPSVRGQITAEQVKAEIRFKPPREVIRYFADTDRADERAMRDQGRRG